MSEEKGYEIDLSKDETPFFNMNTEEDYTEIKNKIKKLTV